MYYLLQRKDLNIESPQFRHLSYIVQLQDILKIAKFCNFTFIKVSLQANDLVDRLAKQARLYSQRYLVKWPM